MGKGVKVPVSVRALMARINRKLHATDRALKKARGVGRARLDVGEFYVVSGRRNLAVSTHVDPEDLGRELGVLRPWEGVRE